MESLLCVSIFYHFRIKEQFYSFLRTGFARNVHGELSVRKILNDEIIYQYLLKNFHQNASLTN